MNMFMTNRQSDSPQRSSAPNHLIFLVSILGIFAVAVGVWLVWDQQDPTPLPSASGANTPSSTESVPQLTPAIGPIAGESSLRAVDTALPERSLADAEREFLASREKETQLEAVSEIAGHNDAAAVETLARIFPRSQDPEVKESVLARLADIDPAVAPETRIALLQGALFGQPRNVRLTALDVLGQSEDPRALIALQRAAREDPDKSIREAAAAIAEAVGGDGR
jgi:hypothetical protein